MAQQTGGGGNVADVAMDFAAMEALAKSISTKRKELEQMLNEMDKLVDGAANKWRGKAHQRFSSTYQSIEADLRRVVDSLEKYQKAIEDSKICTKDTDTNSAKSISNISF